MLHGRKESITKELWSNRGHKRVYFETDKNIWYGTGGYSNIGALISSLIISSKSKCNSFIEVSKEVTKHNFSVVF